MPTDEMVEKVARAIYEARGAHEPPRAWRKWEGIGDEARAVWCQCAVAALSAAHAAPVAWHFPAGPTFAERDLCWGYAARKEEAEKAAVWGGVQPMFASPPIRDEVADLLALLKRADSFMEILEGGQLDEARAYDVRKMSAPDIAVQLPGSEHDRLQRICQRAFDAYKQGKEMEVMRASLSEKEREVERAVAAEKAAWEAELRPLVEAGAFDGVLFTTCETCGALLTDDEVAPIEDGPKGCWRAATGRDKDNCPGEGRKRITATLTQEPTND